MAIGYRAGAGAILQAVRCLLCRSVNAEFFSFACDISVYCLK